MDTEISISYPGFRWLASENLDGESFLCKEWIYSEHVATYNLRETSLMAKMEDILLRKEA